MTRSPPVAIDSTPGISPLPSGNASPPPPTLTVRLRTAGAYTRRDAERKVVDKLRLLAQGGLPPRALPAIETAYQVPDLTAERGPRAARLAARGRALRQDRGWHADPARPARGIGIKATVGLGKSTAARRRLLALRSRLVAAGAPAALLSLSPHTHSPTRGRRLARGRRRASRCCAAMRRWTRGQGRRCARDLAAVKAAIEARLDVHETACAASSGRRCAFFDGCLEAAQPGRGRRGRRYRRRAPRAFHRLCDRGRIDRRDRDRRRSLEQRPPRGQRMFDVDAFRSRARSITHLSRVR